MDLTAGCNQSVESATQGYVFGIYTQVCHITIQRRRENGFLRSDKGDQVLEEVCKDIRIKGELSEFPVTNNKNRYIMHKVNTLT